MDEADLRGGYRLTPPAPITRRNRKAPFPGELVIVNLNREFDSRCLWHDAQRRRLYELERENPKCQ